MVTATGQNLIDAATLGNVYQALSAQFGDSLNMSVIALVDAGVLDRAAYNAAKAGGSFNAQNFLANDANWVAGSFKNAVADTAATGEMYAAFKQNADWKTAALDSVLGRNLRHLTAELAKPEFASLGIDFKALSLPEQAQLVALAYHKGARGTAQWLAAQKASTPTTFDAMAAAQGALDRLSESAAAGMPTLASIVAQLQTGAGAASGLGSTVVQSSIVSAPNRGAYIAASDPAAADDTRNQAALRAAYERYVGISDETTEIALGTTPFKGAITAATDKTMLPNVGDIVALRQRAMLNQRAAEALLREVQSLNDKAEITVTNGSTAETLTKGILLGKAQDAVSVAKEKVDSLDGVMTLFNQKSADLAETQALVAARAAADAETEAAADAAGKTAAAAAVAAGQAHSEAVTLPGNATVPATPKLAYKYSDGAAVAAELMSQNNALVQQVAVTNPLTGETNLFLEWTGKDALDRQRRLINEQFAVLKPQIDALRGAIDPKNPGKYSAAAQKTHGETLAALTTKLEALQADMEKLGGIAAERFRPAFTTDSQKELGGWAATIATDSGAMAEAAGVLGKVKADLGAIADETAIATILPNDAIIASANQQRRDNAALTAGRTGLLAGGLLGRADRPDRVGELQTPLAVLDQLPTAQPAKGAPAAEVALFKLYEELMGQVRHAYAAARLTLSDKDGRPPVPTRQEVVDYITGTGRMADHTDYFDTFYMRVLKAQLDAKIAADTSLAPLNAKDNAVRAAYADALALSAIQEDFTADQGFELFKTKLERQIAAANKPAAGGGATAAAAPASGLTLLDALPDVSAAQPAFIFSDWDANATGTKVWDTPTVAARP